MIEVSNCRYSLSYKPAISESVTTVGAAELDDTYQLSVKYCFHTQSVYVPPLNLLPDYLIDRPSQRLDKLWPPRDTPWLAALVRTIRDDPVDLNLLSVRLSAFEKAVKQRPRWKNILRGIPCIPWRGKLRRP